MILSISGYTSAATMDTAVVMELSATPLPSGHYHRNGVVGYTDSARTVETESFLEEDQIITKRVCRKEGSSESDVSLASNVEVSMKRFEEPKAKRRSSNDLKKCVHQNGFTGSVRMAENDSFVEGQDKVIVKRLWPSDASPKDHLLWNRTEATVSPAAPWLEPSVEFHEETVVVTARGSSGIHKNGALCYVNTENVRRTETELFIEEDKVIVKRLWPSEASSNPSASGHLPWNRTEATVCPAAPIVEPSTECHEETVAVTARDSSGIHQNGALCYVNNENVRRTETELYIEEDKVIIKRLCPTEASPNLATPGYLLWDLKEGTVHRIRSLGELRDEDGDVDVHSSVESAARIEVYPLSAPEDRAKEQQLRQQQQYLQQQLRYEKALEREQIERKAREEENLLIREEQERLRRLFERERAERERLEQIRRREAEERERLLRLHRQEEQERQRLLAEEEKLRRQLQYTQPYHLQYPPQQLSHHWDQEQYPPSPHYVPAPRQEVFHEQRTFSQQTYPQPAPRHHHEHYRSVTSTDNQFRQFNQYQQHIESQQQRINMPATAKTTGGPMANGESAVSATRKVIPGHSHEHGAALVPSRPPQFLVHPQSVAAKAGETVTFTCQTTGVPPPTLEWCRVDGTPIQTGGKFKIEHGTSGDSKLIIEKA
ncbi:unnamed protein product [Heligmosomoides polygyrus]|uniref:Ig-like domain-containing protein n=1 Tax=Heligmosomoides polygyrus TaxID=6339 RepID=A0A3P7X1T0_HELPZ|nr:unnamed protein product [Heligmosomoides polygyrus]